MVRDARDITRFVRCDAANHHWAHFSGALIFWILILLPWISMAPHTILAEGKPQQAQAVHTPNKILIKFTRDPVEQQHVLAAAKRSTVMLKSPCPGAKLKILNKISIYKPAQFDSSGKIIEGAWKQVVAAEGCGRNRILNVFLEVEPKTRALMVMPMLPGTTHADIVLQKNAVQYAVIAAGGKEKNCNTNYISDTQFLQKKKETVEGVTIRPWDELWTLVTCTRIARVTMHFIPDKTGTTIATGQPETRFLSVGSTK